MIKFGTDGWRGIIGDDFTAANVRRVSRAVASYLVKKGGRKAVIGYDRRFLSDRFAELTAKELAQSGLEVYLSSCPVPTPCLSFAVKEFKADGGLMITASHNPAIYNGLKFKEAFGGPALPETTALIEAELKSPSCPSGKGLVQRSELLGPYLERLRSLVDFEQVARRPLRILVNPMYGSAAGVLPRLFEGTQVHIREINSAYNPGFGGRSPEPTEENLKGMAAQIRRLHADLGIAFDGDGDRLALIDANGNYVSPQKVFALILCYLLDNGRVKGGVAKTVSTTGMINVLCQKGSLKVYETPVGFKHIAEKMLTDNVAIGGEESGGIGLKEHMPDRDAILAAMVIIEMMAANHKSLSGLVRRLRGELGSFHYARKDLALSPNDLEKMRDSLEKDYQLGVSRPEPLKVMRLDGFKYLFSDNSWLLLRPSGTEPVLRIYAEAESQKKLWSLLEIGDRRCLGKL